MARETARTGRLRDRAHGYRPIAATVAAAMALGLGAGCTDSASRRYPGTGPGVVLRPNEDPVEPHNDADVAFVRAMITYHERTLELARVGEARAQRPELREIAQRLRLVQEAEVHQLTEWLDEWTGSTPSPSPSPSTSPDLFATPLGFPPIELPPLTVAPPANEPSPPTDAPSPEASSPSPSPSPRARGATPRPRGSAGAIPTLAELQEAPADQFDQLYIDAVLAHCEEALRIAETEQRQGKHEGARELATRIIQAQREEIKLLRELRK